MSKVIDQDGNQLAWTAVYARHRVQREQKCESMADALSYLHYGADAGELMALSIIEPDGRVVEGEELADALERLDEDKGRQIEKKRAYRDTP